MADTKIKTEKLIEFLLEARTLPEISKHFQVPPEMAANILKKRAQPKGYNLFVHRDESQEFIYVYAAEPQNQLIIKPKLWSYRIHKTLPYMWVSFPDDLQFRKITLVPITDAHYGSVAHLSKEFDEYLQWIKASDNVFGFLAGDEMENTHQDFPPGGVFEQNIRPRDQLTQLRAKLAPLAHKILFGTPGNHEWRTAKKTDIDPLWIICDSLGIPYFDEPVYIDILWKGYTFTIYCQHGGGNSATKGGKLNRAIKPLTFLEHVMFNIMGHVHDPMLDDTPRICRERKFNEKGELVSFRLVHKKQYTIICPSFLEYFGSYGARSGYAPPNYGITTCELYPNGNYHATS